VFAGYDTSGNTTTTFRADPAEDMTYVIMGQTSQ
jgi:hypothetical protein